MVMEGEVRYFSNSTWIPCGEWHWRTHPTVPSFVCTD